MILKVDLIFILSVTWIFVLNSIQGAKILGLFPLASRSHWNAFKPFLQELGARGHEITSVSILKPNLQMPNIKEAEVTELKVFLEKDNVEYVFRESSDYALSRLLTFRTVLNDVCKLSLSSSAIKNLLKQGKIYDLVLVHAYANDCAVQIAPLLGKYVILLSPSPLTNLVTFPQTSYPSFIPDRFFSFPLRMNFLERLQNSIGSFIARRIMETIRNDANKMVLEAVPNALTMAEAQDKISIILINSDPILTLPQPTVPRIISIGGLHLSDAKPLSKEFKDIVENTGDDGFIIFSLGSITPSEKMPKPIQEAFLSAFSRLKQKVIWKYDGEIDDLPSNVHLSSWLPQKDLLGHPKCRAFIAHGGLFGLQEAIYFGVPVIGIPLYGDQAGNLALMKSYGIAESLGQILKLTHEEIYKTLIKVLETKSYATTMKKYSSILRDTIDSPVKRGTFWIEYVLRHNGAFHLRSPGEDLSFIQYFLLDVIACIIISIAVVLWIFIVSFKLLLQCGKSKKSGKSKKE